MWLTVTFFGIAFIAILQQIMHRVDFGIEVTRAFPWRQELIYSAFFAFVSAVLLGTSNAIPNLLVEHTVLNGTLLLLTSYINVIYTLRNKLLATGILYCLFLTDHVQSIQILTVAFLFYAVCLLIQHYYFTPFNQHPFATLVIQSVIGISFWSFVVHPNSSYWSLIASYVGAIISIYIYSVLLHNDHVKQIHNEHGIHFDALTGARNWHSFKEDAERHFTNHEPFGLIALDIDHFKRINDQYGHPTGNQALITFTKTIQKCLGTTNSTYRCYRTGGEEFLLLLPEVDFATLTAISQKCHDAIAKVVFETESKDKIKLTASFGTSMLHPNDTNISDVYKRADKNLYVSKRTGRDKITAETPTHLTV